MSNASKTTVVKRVQYGALPYRLRAGSGRPQFMLITSRETQRWVIPKGWPKKGKSPQSSAAREAFEEAASSEGVARHETEILRRRREPFVREHLHRPGHTMPALWMAWTVGVLAVLSVIGGWIQIAGLWHPFGDWLHTIAEPLVEPSVTQDYLTSVLAVGLGLVGIAVAWAFYGAPERRPLPLTVAWHDACHLAHAQGVRAQPREVLGAVPGLELREVGEGEICCGSAGVYNLVEPEPARELGDRKATNVLATGADLLVTSNPGCLMQIRAAVERRGGRLPVAHVAEVLDASVRGADPGSLLRDGRAQSMSLAGRRRLRSTTKVNESQPPGPPPRS